MRGADRREEKLPGITGDLVRLVDADVAAPHDAASVAYQVGDEAGGLRVMQDDDVA